MDGEIATASQPIQIVTNLQSIHLKPLILRSLRCSWQELRGANSIVANEVCRDRDRGPAVNVVGELFEPVGRVREELADAEYRVERTGWFIDLEMKWKFSLENGLDGIRIVRERDKRRETEETRLKSWLRRPRASPTSRILGGDMADQGMTEVSEGRDAGKQERELWVGRLGFKFEWMSHKCNHWVLNEHIDLGQHKHNVICNKWKAHINRINLMLRVCLISFRLLYH